MQERKNKPGTMNSETRNFLESLVSGLTLKYKTNWIMHQNAIDKKGKVFYPTSAGFVYAFDERQVELSRRASEDLEFRGFTLKKFIPAVEVMLEEQTDLPLPNFLSEELSDVGEVLSTKGTILDTNGKAIRYEERRKDEEKTGGVIRIFYGNQIGLKINYGTQPRKNPEIKLIPVVFIKDKHWYDSIYLR